MRSISILIIIFLATNCYSQSLFDSSKLSRKILKVLQQFPELNNDNLIDLDTISIKGFHKILNLKETECLKIINHPKASVRVFASKNLIEKDFKMFWVIITENSSDTLDWFLSSIECDRMPMTRIDYLLNYFGFDSPEHPFSPEQIELLSRLKDERKKHLINYYLNHPNKDY